MLKKEVRQRNNTTNKKSSKNRLFFALSEKEEKGFLSKNNKKIEVLELEEKIKKKHYKKVNHKKIEYLELDNQVIQKNKVRKFDISMMTISAVAVILLVFTFFVNQNSFSVRVKSFLDGLGIYTSELKSIEITSNDYNNPGSWHIDKKVEWIKNRKAQVTLDVDSGLKKSSNLHKDVVFVIDSSYSLDGENMNQLIDSCKDTIDILLADNQNRVAIISFNTNATIISNFSNNKENLNSDLDSLNAAGSRNYRAALTKVDELLDGDQPNPEHDLIVVFIVGGSPILETPNEIASFEILKEKYPTIMIHGIQYEAGSTGILQMYDVTDLLWIAKKETIKNALIESSVLPDKYESFAITDTISNYFTVKKVNVTKGTTTTHEESGNQVVTWNLGNRFSSGTRQIITIELELKEQFFDEEGFIPVSENSTITSKLLNEPEKTTNNNQTMVLKNSFNVIYEINAPSGCNLDETQTEKHLIYENVSKRTDELYCEGYLFKGWEIDESTMKDVKRINDDTFIMPTHDVYIRGTWTKQDIVKSMDGTVSERTTLYKVVEKEANNSNLVLEYTGEHKDSFTQPATQKIYYYHANSSSDVNAIFEKNNVIFAGFCWEMLRTTDNGGVRMIYNGEVVDEQCLSTTRGNQAGYYYSDNWGRITLNLNGNYWYGTRYTYDKENQLFSLDGDLEQVRWNATNGPNLIGKYTCKNTASNGTCSNLYYVEAYKNTTNATAFSLRPKLGSSIGKLEFEMNPGAEHSTENSLAHSGYMHGNPVTIKSLKSSSSVEYSTYTSLLDSKYFSLTTWYADSVSYDEETGYYSLVNPYKVSSTSEYPSLVGKYTLQSSTENYTRTTAYFIAALNGSSNYFSYSLTNGITDYSIAISQSISLDENDNYNLVDAQIISLTEWANNYSNYNKMFMCGNGTASCSDPIYLTSTAKASYYGFSARNKIFIAKTKEGLTLTNGILIPVYEMLLHSENYSDYKYTCNNENSVCSNAELRLIISYTDDGYKYNKNLYFSSDATWDGEKYILENPINTTDFEDQTLLNTHHYTCITEGLQSCTTLGYVTYNNSGSLSYLPLTGGTTDAQSLLLDMLENNTYDSIIKTGIDAWYKLYLEEYTSMLDDSIYCNDRSFLTKEGYTYEESGWSPNGDLTKALYFRSYVDTTDLSCSKVTDQFSMSNPSAHLTYPVAIMTKSERILYMGSGVLGGLVGKGGLSWTLSPSFVKDKVYMNYIYQNGRMTTTSSWEVNNIRPVITLAPGTEFLYGEGTTEDPYVIDMSNN